MFRPSRSKAFNARVLSGRSGRRLSGVASTSAASSSSRLYSSVTGVFESAASKPVSKRAAFLGSSAYPLRGKNEWVRAFLCALRRKAHGSLTQSSNVGAA